MAFPRSRGRSPSPLEGPAREARIWRIDPAANHGAMNGLARHRINTELIARNWDDILRVAGSFVRGTISDSELLGSFMRGSKHQ